jgi:carbonic anhydrase-like protein
MFGRKKLKKVTVMLTCADWRLHNDKVEMNKRVARQLGVDGVDVIAVPGPDGLVKKGREGEWQVALDQIKLLIGAHTPVSLVVVAHQRCAGHPVTDPEHDHDAAETARELKHHTGFAGPVLAYVAVYRSDLDWDFKRVGMA